jgi:hypothetical protein
MNKVILLAKKKMVRVFIGRFIQKATKHLSLVAIGNCDLNGTSGILLSM